MSEPHLILHRVRGEPAFDIAEQVQIGEELGWIIPTSGHRAYPYREWPLDLLEGPAFYPQHMAWAFGKHVIIPDDWLDLPDHYQSTSPRTGQEVTTDLLSTLGLTQPPKTFLRR